MTDKEKYRNLCMIETSINLYQQDWFLDCVCGENNWNVLLFLQKNNIEAAMPFYMPKKGIIIMPPYAQYLGIWFNPDFEDNKYSTNLFRKQQICDFFIKHLPKHKIFLQNFHSSFNDWLPFYWKGFNQTTRYNYVIPSIKDKEELWENLNSNIQRNIIKAEKNYNLKIKNNISIDLFIDILIQTYKRQEEKPYHFDVLKKLISLAKKRCQGEIWGAYDETNALHAAVFIIWENNCAWYIAGGGNTELRKSGGHAFVMWKAINELPKQINSFDFEGSMDQGIERFFKSFGAIQKTYFTISKGKLNLFQKIIMKFTKK